MFFYVRIPSLHCHFSSYATGMHVLKTLYLSNNRKRKVLQQTVFATFEISYEIVDSLVNIRM